MYATAFLALASVAVAAPLAPRASSTKSTPAHWKVDYLENYQSYHLRYLALECYNQKNTTFFDECCHPLSATQTLADRPEYCTPNATAIASVVASQSADATASATSTVTASADAAAESEYSQAVTSTSAAVETSAVVSAAAQYVPQEASSAAPTSEWVAPTTTEAAAPAQTSEASNNDNNSSPSGDVKTGGYATFFYQGGNPGACGVVHSDSDKIVAIDGNGYWQNFGVQSEYCGRWVNIKNTQNGKTVTAMVADVCPTCVSDNSLDLSVGAFTAIADEWEGSVPITWSWA